MPAADTLQVRFLEGDAHAPADVAAWLADFVSGARHSLDLAFYDVRLSDDLADPLRRALADRRRAGVRLRLCYDAGDKPQGPAAQDERGADPAPRDTHRRVAELGLPPDALRAVAGPQALMHHKYVVRDGTHVWTGSTNLTDDAFGRMDNTVLTLASPRLAAYYARDFGQLWATGRIGASGAFPTEADALTYAGAPARADVDFSPGQGRAINAWVAETVRAARRRVVLCSMLFTSSRLLRALLETLDRGDVEVWGVYDRTQMAGVLEQWRERPDLDWKVAAVERVVAEARLVGKASTPYRPGASHDFMHAKTIVVDGAVLTGSHNFSHAAQDNAENLLLIRSPALADACAAFARRLAARDASPARP